MENFCDAQTLISMTNTIMKKKIKIINSEFKEDLNDNFFLEIKI